MKKKICIVLCLGCIGTVSVVGCSNKNFDSKVTGDNQTTTENVSDILNDQEKKEGGYENESSSNADDKENSADDSEVLANADLRGAVLEFSDTGCNISIGTQTDDAEMVPAPGAVVECLFLQECTVVPEERIPLFRLRDTVRPEQDTAGIMPASASLLA